MRDQDAAGKDEAARPAWFVVITLRRDEVGVRRARCACRSMTNGVTTTLVNIASRGEPRTAQWY